MTVVIADTSPINYLVLIGEIGVLQRLYSQIVIPSAVFDELISEGAPPSVRQWASSLPNWVEIRSVSEIDPALRTLDYGESAAIALAEQEPNVLLLIDDQAGRSEALRRGIANTGTLGVLRAAALAGLVDLPLALNRLLATNFRVSAALIAGLLAEAEQGGEES